MEFVVGKALDLCDVDHNESSKSDEASHDEESSVANSDKLKNISHFTCHFPITDDLMDWSAELFFLFNWFLRESGSKITDQD